MTLIGSFMWHKVSGPFIPIQPPRLEENDSTSRSPVMSPSTRREEKNLSLASHRPSSSENVVLRAKANICIKSDAGLVFAQGNPQKAFSNLFAPLQTPFQKHNALHIYGD